MQRHRLAALFEPRSLLVLSQRRLPVLEQAVPAGATTESSIVAGTPITVPARLQGVAPGERLDLALLCVDAARLPEALASLSAHRPRALILLYTDTPSAHPQEDVAVCRAWARQHDCALLGPRSFGVQRPAAGFNFSHMPRTAQAGRVALVTQSRSLAAAVLDWALDVRLGFSTVISLGEEAQVDLPQVLDYLTTDPTTDSIALYIHETASARELYSAMRAAAGVKPVVVLKAARTREAPIGQAVFDALLRRAGAVRVPYFVQLFSALKVLRYTSQPRGRRIAILSNGGGAAQLALNVMRADFAVEPAQLSQSTQRELAALMTPGAPLDNPVVEPAPLQADMALAMVEALVRDAGVDGVLVLLAPDPLADLHAVALRMAEIAPRSRKPVITCFMGEQVARPLRHVLDDVGTPAFRTPESAVNAFGILAAYHYNQTLSLQTLPPEPLRRAPDLDQARAVLQEAQAQGRTELTPQEGWRLLDCFHVPLRQGGPGAAGPDETPLSLRLERDPELGPYVRFGAGGTAATGGPGRAVELPPLNGYLARQLVERSTIWERVLAQEISPAAYESLQELIERVSDLTCELPQVQSLTLDPMKAGGTHMYLPVLALRVRIAPVPQAPPARGAGYPHMAIHPYPRGLVQSLPLRDGRHWVLRPIRPEDAEPLQAFIRGLSETSRYMRFVSMLRELTAGMLARYTRIDYDRELALVATMHQPNPAHRGHPTEQIIGFAHYLRHGDGRGAEYALVIGDDWQRYGLGSRLMQALIQAARQQRLSYIDGYVLATNTAMLALMQRLGFANDPCADDPSLRRVWLSLDADDDLAQVRPA